MTWAGAIAIAVVVLLGGTMFFVLWLLCRPNYDELPEDRE